MWWPRSVADLKAAFEAGDLVESHSLELKRELPAPGKSIDVAIDVCAMTADGGVIVYGVSDLDAAAGELVPFDLAGQRDRVFQIVAAGIAEAPRIDVLELPESDNDDGRRGFLVVVVPASSRAPHMVTVKGERRYYGRNGTQNVRLGEGEVARLYERRSQRAVDTDALLDGHIARSTVPASLHHGRLYLIVAPALGDDELLERARAATAVPGREFFPAILSEHLRRARTVAPSRGFAPTTDHLAAWTPTSRGFSVSSALDGGPDLSSTDPDSALKIEVSYGGGVTIDCGRAAFGDRSGGRLYIFEQLIAGLTIQGLAFAGSIYDAAGYMGGVDAGLAVHGIEGGVSAELFSPPSRAIDQPVPYDRDQYRRVAHLSAIGLARDPHGPAGLLVNALTRTTIGTGHESLLERFRP